MSNHFTSLSRASCAESAKQISTIFELYRSRFDLAQAYGTAVQHAGTAATALMGEVILQSDVEERDIVIEKLASLRLAISLMARNYQPAGAMTSVVDQFIRSMHSSTTEQSQRPTELPSQPPERAPNSESSAPAARFNDASSLDFSRQPDLGCVASVRKRARMDSSFTFTPTCAAAQSPSGLPFLPSAFLEGLATDDGMFGDLAGMTDGNFQWDYTSWMP